MSGDGTDDVKIPALFINKVCNLLNDGVNAGLKLPRVVWFVCPWVIVNVALV